MALRTGQGSRRFQLDLNRLLGRNSITRSHRGMATLSYRIENKQRTYPVHALPKRLTTSRMHDK